jgi:hypothetical protein
VRVRRDGIYGYPTIGMDRKASPADVDTESVMAMIVGIHRDET